MQPPPLVLAVEDSGGGGVVNKTEKLSPDGVRLGSGTSEESRKGDGRSGPEASEEKRVAMPKEEAEVHGGADDNDDADFKISKKRFRVPVKAETGPVSFS